MFNRRRSMLLAMFLAALAAFAAGAQVGEVVADSREPDVTVTIGRPQPPVLN